MEVDYETGLEKLTMQQNRFGGNMDLMMNLTVVKEKGSNEKK